MLDKNVLRVESPLNDSIIAIDSSPTLYVDDLFYREVFKEDVKNQSYKAYPVEVFALKIDWIVSTPAGKEFLSALSQSENLDFFDITTLQIIIEFLYAKSKRIMLYVFLPLYLIQVGFFILTMLFTEIQVKAERGEHLMSDTALYSLKWVIVLGNQFFTFLMVGIMCFVWKVMGNTFLKRTYTWVDIGFYSLNTLTNILIVEPTQNNVENQRRLCAFAILLFLCKTFYYLKLVD
jgi:hypothetical protein